MLSSSCSRISSPNFCPGLSERGKGRKKEDRKCRGVSEIACTERKTVIEGLNAIERERDMLSFPFPCLAGMSLNHIMAHKKAE